MKIENMIGVLVIGAMVLAGVALVFLILTPFGLNPIFDTFGEKTLIAQGYLTDLRNNGDYGTYNHFTPYINGQSIGEGFTYDELYNPIAKVVNTEGQVLYDLSDTGTIIKIGTYYYLYSSSLPMKEQAYLLTTSQLPEEELAPISIRDLKNEDKSK